jgi:hypothetical protein
MYDMGPLALEGLQNLAMLLGLYLTGTTRLQISPTLLHLPPLKLLALPIILNINMNN